MKDPQGQEDSDGEYVITLQDGTPYLEVVSGLQKMVRRGKEREALTFALSLFDSGFGLALAKRLVMIATEDIGLAAPEVVSQVCTLSSTWILLRKESPRGMPEPLPLIMAVMMCRSDKNREVDDSCVVIRETTRRGTGDSPKQIIQKREDLIVDSHTSRGKQRLRLQAMQRVIPYEQLAWHEFYEKGAFVSPLKRVGGNPWGHEAYALFGLYYDECASPDSSTSGVRKNGRYLLIDLLPLIGLLLLIDPPLAMDLQHRWLPTFSP